MEAVITSLLSGFPVLMVHIAVTLAMLAGGIALYQLITPHHEFSLIRANNVAAAISLAGAVFGLAVPLAVSMATSVNVWDIVVWGAVALLIQLLTFWVVDLVLRDLSRRIEQGEIGAAIFVAGVKLAAAAINAAAIAG